jgi:hypothetical protein
MKQETPKLTLSIKNLRRSGWKVRVLHQRNYFLRDRFNGTSSEVSAKGGITEIQLTSPDKQINVSGKAVCSEKENYSRKVGNAIALGRAWSEVEKIIGHKI